MVPKYCLHLSCISLDRSISSTNAPFPKFLEHPPVVRQPSTRLRRDIGRNPSLPSPQAKAIFAGILTIRPSAALPRPSRSQALVGEG